MEPKDAISEKVQTRPNSHEADTLTPAFPPVPIPDHELLRCIGRGSYGEVWLARNQMGVFRAVKIVHRSAFQDVRPFERELSGIRKFEPISRSHEGFVDVLHVGLNEKEGYFYYIMELGDDQQSGHKIQPDSYSPKTLAKEIALNGRLSAHACLDLGLALSKALAELHKNELVHRDIKPSNIIFINGVPKLADLGLVAPIAEARSYVGTFGFIPPEGPGSRSADIYSLGKVLYEACTGMDRQQFPVLPLQVDTFPDRAEVIELNEIVVHACQNEPAARYASAWDMHAELVALANGKSIRRLRVLEKRMARFKRVGMAMLVSAGVLALLSYPIYQQWRSAFESRQRQVGSDIANGTRTMESGDMLGALPYFADALSLDQSAPQRALAHRLRIGSALAQCPKLTRLWSLGVRVNSGEFSPDDKHVLVSRFLGQAEIYDVTSGALCARPFAQDGGLSSAAYSQDGQWIVTASQSGNASVWNASNLELVVRIPHATRVLNAQFRPDGRCIVTAGEDGVARIFNAQSGQPELPLEGHAGPVHYAAFSHDGRRIITASADHTVRLWDAALRTPIGQPLVHPEWVTWAAFSPDDQKLVTACTDHNARVWDLNAGNQIMPALEHDNAVRSAAFSPDGRLIVTASFDGSVRLWRSSDLHPLAPSSVLRHGQGLTEASFSSDGRLVLTTCLDGTVRIWDLAGSTMSPVALNRNLGPNLAGVPAPHLRFCPDGTRFLLDTNENLSIWDTSSQKLISSLPLPAQSTKAVALSYHGAFLAVISAGGTNANDAPCQVRVWQTETSRPVAPPFLIPNDVSQVVLSDDGKQALTYSGNSAQNWDTLTGKPLSPPLILPSPVKSACFCRDGTKFACVCDTQVALWHAPDGKPVCPPLNHGRQVGYAQFSPDGSLLVACCSDPLAKSSFAQIWNTTSGRAQCPPLPHRDGVRNAAFSTDSRHLVTASEDFTAIEWDAHTGKQLTTQPLRHKHQVGGAAFSPDGNWIVTASADKTARVWSADAGVPLTPPLIHLGPVSDAWFMPEGRTILTADHQGNGWLWELPVDNRPVADLLQLSCLLSGGATVNSSLSTGSFQSIWQELRTKYPADFTSSPEEIFTWHDFEARASELQSQWRAAVFHLQRLIELRPADQSLKDRLNRAEKQIQESRRDER